MTYIPGDYVDLRYINRKSELKKNTLRTQASHYYTIGTSFIFRITPEGYKAARVIPVLAIA